MMSQGKASSFDLNLVGSNVMNYAAKHNGLETSRFLIAQGADPHHSNDAGEVGGEYLLDGALTG